MEATQEQRRGRMTELDFVKLPCDWKLWNCRRISCLLWDHPLLELSFQALMLIHWSFVNKRQIYRLVLPFFLPPVKLSAASLRGQQSAKSPSLWKLSRTQGAPRVVVPPVHVESFLLPPPVGTCPEYLSRDARATLPGFSQWDSTLSFS